MSVGDAVSIMRGGIFEILILAAPVLLVAMVVGLVVSIFQATTSIQEQTLTFVPKIVAIMLVLALIGRLDVRQPPAIHARSIRHDTADGKVRR